MSANQVPALIGGTFRESSGSQVDDIPDPATGETIARLPHSTGEEIDQAVAAAREVFPGWADTPPPDRAQPLFRLKALMEEHFEELSLLVTRENGKTLP
jgi:malonate-semialdehyde dehydrogenase (acetylating) / methylmalonate-semialdehyde dehydrogenase